MTEHLKKIGLVLTLITAICGAGYGLVEAAVTLDDRYLHKKTSHTILDTRYMKVADYKTEKANERIRILEEKIFVINFKIQSNTATALERAMKERYESELQSLRNNAI